MFSTKTHAMNRQYCKNSAHQQKQDDCYLLISARQLKHLQHQINLLSRNLSDNHVSHFFTILQDMSKQEELAIANNTKIEKLETEVNHWKTQCSQFRDKYLHEKEKKLTMWEKLQELTNQLSSQLDFCNQMGSVYCTMLWHMSQTEEAVLSMLNGGGVDKLLEMIIRTLQSFMQATDDDTFEVTEELNEFVLSLYGIITNIAAVGQGRVFITEHPLCDSLLEILISGVSINGVVPAVTIKMKRLCMMALYNISINQSGQRKLSSNHAFLSMLAKTLNNEKDSELCTSCLHLIQSLMYEQNDAQFLKVFKNMFPISSFEKLASASKNKEIAAVASELFEDMLMWEA